MLLSLVMWLTACMPRD
ncbi:hypothetical protein F383_11311 [Gossypium arboreum]|uniref:Uncharacterized protein n=1 Tax=Gossypium arboreum TaxID=29729 RepID=A0A0B0Q1N6_GOSAR|nr:hypothetical protein F383_11311 [Gossypium arboreum]